MTTLEAIGFTVAGGSVVFLTTLTAFGFAVRHRCIAIAPRCTARPPDTVYASNPKYPEQDRGNAWTGWIPWTLHLSYDAMLRGIPGTGTRKNGMEGTMLGVNLDAIILFRFHALCLRVSILATILAIGIILPINWTACVKEKIDEDTIELDGTPIGSKKGLPDYIMYGCSNDYNRTTLGNIPPLIGRGMDASSSFSILSFGDVLWGPETGILLRLYTIVFCSWLIGYYVCKQVEKEWKDALALRRAYYLEADHHFNRKKQLEETLLEDEDSDDDSDDEKAPVNKARKKRDKQRSQAMSKRRDPWIPHPEQRDTVPNIELYSVLVGGLPALPSEVVDEKDIEAAMGFSRRQSVDWQLAVTTAFFDHCVPNQPGFSSSVAAVTILPDAPALATAWREWYKAAAALRRLRFIRTLIADRRYFDIDPSDLASYNDDNSYEKGPPMVQLSRVDGGNIGTSQDVDTITDHLDYSTVQHNNSNEHELDQETKRQRLIYLENENRISYYREVFGSTDNEEVESQLFQALNYGPEQTAVYSREMAQGAAACCPNGCGEERVRHSRIDELLVMERDAVEAVHQANLCLQRAQHKATVQESMSEDSAIKDVKEQSKGQVELTELDRKRLNPIPSCSLSAEDSNSNIPLKSSTHRRLVSYEEVNLPDNLGMETQILTKYNRSPVVNPKSHPTLSDSRDTDTSNSFLSSSPLPTGVTTPQRSNAKKQFDPNGVKNSTLNFGNMKHNSHHLPPLPPPPLPGSGAGTSVTPPDQNINNQMLMPPHPSQHFYYDTTLKMYINVQDKRFPSVHDDNATQLTPSSISSTTTHAQGRKRTNSDFSKQSNGYSRRFGTMSLNAEGKFYLRDGARRVMSEITPNRDITTINYPGVERERHVQSVGTPYTSDQEIPRAIPRGNLSRRGRSSVHWNKEPSVEWRKVEKISEDVSIASSPYKRQSTGEWAIPEVPPVRDWRSNVWGTIRTLLERLRKWATKKSAKAVDQWARESTFAVVTFTNRQAAVAARHCLADGRGASRWTAADSLPVPPLADAASCDLITCRACCRPVTLSIPKRQQMVRKFIAMTLLITIYIFYTFPITFASSLIDPSSLYNLFPNLQGIVESSFLLKKLFSGIVPAALLTLFFSLCPVMFRAISNFGSTANSVSTSEHSAMKYYWWFMVVTAFSGSTLMHTALNALSDGLDTEGSSFAKVLFTIAATLPTQTSATWLNWILIRTFMVLPFQYLFQFNTFLFQFLGWKCCARCVMGGGPGGPIPYRIYIDTGVVFMCVVALSVASPLMAPVALVYMLVCQPLWRRNCIYLYRPKFDGGGHRWPFLSDVCLSSLMLGQLLLATMMVLKQAIGPSIFSALPFIPTLMFRRLSRMKYYRPYQDAGLLQTSLLDLWDTSEPSSTKKREEFRRWLVDAHKAAYIPVCIAGDSTNEMTTEPAVVVPLENDSTSQPLQTQVSS